MPHQETSSTFSLADALWRRRWLAAGVVLWTLTVAIGAAVSLPDLYRAAATVIVQRESESRSLSPIEVTADLEARIQTITQETLSRTHLETLIGHFNIYPEIQRRDGLEAAVNRLRSDVKLQFKDSSADTNVPGTAAFTVSVVHADPFVAALVANNLAASYLEQNQHIRNGQAHDTAELLKAQLDEAKRRLDSQNQQASSLRQRYAGELPEQATANLAALERLSTELRLNGDRQQRATERREQLIAPVAAPRPGAGAYRHSPRSPGDDPAPGCSRQCRTRSRSASRCWGCC